MSQATRPVPSMSPDDIKGHVRRLRRRVKGRSLGVWIGLPCFLLAAVLGAAASFTVPVGAPAVSADARLLELVKKGPESYFHHIFDPDGLLGQLGQIDLTLDNFERETSHGVLIAALPRSPADRADFTIRTAEIWQPGVAGADNGVLVFVFPEERTIRVDVGYGFESVLPDVEVRRLVAETFLPLASNGDIPSGLEALVPPLLERLRTVPWAQPVPRAPLAEIVVAAGEIPRRARVVWVAWLGGVIQARLILSAVAALLVAVLAVLLARIVVSVLLVIRRARSRGDATALRSATSELAASLLGLVQAAAILFIMVVGTSFFFPGTGGFGGGGVELLW